MTHTERDVITISSKNAKGLVAYAIRCEGERIFGFTDILTGQNAHRGPFGNSDENLSSMVPAFRPLAWLRDGRTLFYEVTLGSDAHPAVLLPSLAHGLAKRGGFQARRGCAERRRP